MNTKFCFDNTRLFKTQYGLNFSEKIIVDFFAGGGGASTGPPRVLYWVIKLIDSGLVTILIFMKPAKSLKR
ncbi:TPA: hypothetical protein JI105_00335 [Acinetobacter baumannii]|nr:hypothetical protein [Acinetobacter baumannii]